MNKYTVIWLTGTEAEVDADKVTINGSGDLCFYRQNITEYEMVGAFSKGAWSAVFQEKTRANKEEGEK